jgi:AcrR family transcriptional regulator
MVWYYMVPLEQPYGTARYLVKGDILPKAAASDPLRQRIIAATFDVLMERGYAGASTLEIARRAKVSKRELYAQFGSKRGILEALVSSTATRMQVPLTSAADLTGRDTLIAALTGYGAAALTELTNPHVVAIYRLAIAEAGRSADLGKILDQAGREPNRRALIDLMTRARAAGMLQGEPDAIAGKFFSLLTGDLVMRLLLGAIRPPRAREIAERAQAATEALLKLHGT